MSSHDRQTKLEVLRHTPKPLYFKDRQLALFWSAKAGCTFAVKWFFSQMGLLEAAYFYSHWIHNYRQDVFYESEGYRLHIEDIFKNKTTVIKVVRNPYSRLISSYINAVKSGHSNRAISALLNREVDAGNGFSFAEFIEYLESINLKSCNSHHQVQLHPAEQHNLVKIDYVVQLENSFDKLRQIELDLDLRQSDLLEFSKSKHHSVKDVNHSFCGDEKFCTVALQNQQKVPITRCFYNSILQEKAKKLYEVDFRAYDYDLDIIPI